MSSLSLGFQVLYTGRLTVRYLVTSELPCYEAFAKVTTLRYPLAGLAQWMNMTSRTAYSLWTPQKPTLLMAINTVNVQLWI